VRQIGNYTLVDRISAYDALADDIVTLIDAEYR
jgi:hypothetical protein